MNKRRKYKITQEHIAKLFGYASADSLHSSSAKKALLKGIDSIITHIEKQLIEQLSS